MFQGDSIIFKKSSPARRAGLGPEPLRAWGIVLAVMRVKVPEWSLAHARRMDFVKLRFAGMFDRECRGVPCTPVGDRGSPLRIYRRGRRPRRPVGKLICRLRGTGCRGRQPLRHPRNSPTNCNMTISIRRADTSDRSGTFTRVMVSRSEEHTSELQSR